jgi:hypothetical protein
VDERNCDVLVIAICALVAVYLYHKEIFKKRKELYSLDDSPPFGL